MQSKINNIKKLKAKVEACKKCPLHEGRTNVVFGSGNPDADVMIIGEAPGKNEDEQGCPFVGKAGAYLDELLAMAGLLRDEVFIANVLKCRPPSNRDPKAEEILACSPFLRDQTALIKPKLIITLGNFATHFILKTEVGISELQGKPVHLGKFTVLPVFHPASAIYDPTKKHLLHSSFSQIPLLMKDTIEK